MITNTDQRVFDVIEVTNEMPVNRIGGVGSVIENLYTGLKSIGVNSLWFLTDNSYTEDELTYILNTYEKVAIGTYEELLQFSAPVIHEHSYRFDSGMEIAFKRFNTVFTIHSLLAFEEIFNNVALSSQVKWQEKLIAKSDTVVLISETERKKYIELGYKELNENFRVIHNGLKLPAAGTKKRRDKKVFGYCGRLVPRKRPEYSQLILLEDGFSDCSTYIAGKAFSFYAKDLVESNNLEQRVRYLGWCGGPRLEAFYNAIDVLVIPSTYEPFGMCALEAAARNIPVICSRVDGLEEIFGDHAFYFEPGNYNDFVQAARQWKASSNSEIESISILAKKRMKRYFSDTIMAEKYQIIFKQMKER